MSVVGVGWGWGRGGLAWPAEFIKAATGAAVLPLRNNPPDHDLCLPPQGPYAFLVYDKSYGRIMAARDAQVRVGGVGVAGSGGWSAPAMLPQ